jgi:hypothetical protein
MLLLMNRMLSVGHGVAAAAATIRSRVAAAAPRAARVLPNHSTTCTSAQAIGLRWFAGVGKSIINLLFVGMLVLPFPRNVLLDCSSFYSFIGMQQRGSPPSGFSTSGSNYGAPRYALPPSSTSEEKDEKVPSRSLTPGEERRQIRHLSRLMNEQRQAAQAAYRPIVAAASAMPIPTSSISIEDSAMMNENAPKLFGFISNGTQVRARVALQKAIPLAFESLGNDKQDGGMCYTASMNQIDANR